MLGDVLRREREKKQLTLKDVENGISIRTLYIESIENENFEKLPGEAYAKGFIRSYSNFLGLDPVPLLEDYKKLTHSEDAEPQPDAGNESKKPEEPVRTKTSSYSYSKNTNFGSSSFSSGSDFKARVENSRTHQKYIAFLVAVVVFLGGVWFAFSDDGTKSDDSKPAVKTEQQKKSADKAQQEAQDGVNVSAKFKNNCWTQVNVDGRVVFEGTVEGGKTMEWNGKDHVVITAGNAGAVEITYNGESLGKLGADGEVVEKTYGGKDASDNNG